MDNLDKVKFYQMSLELWDEFWNDSESMMNYIRGREIVKQLTRSVGSISANIEEGYGRGKKKYPHFLKIARGSARETRGWYIKSKFLLKKEVIDLRVAKLNSISAMITKSIETLENKLK
ncbi:MAG: four helix bundle protein [Bacteroidia bacterium]